MREVQNRQHNWSCAMRSIVYEWVHAIFDHCDPNILGIYGKFRISRINISALCDISLMFYHSDILLMLLFRPSQQF
jgi:hypothetical protein